ncbi:MAG: hypothetical protein ACK5TF_04435 [bacterium]
MAVTVAEENRSAEYIIGKIQFYSSTNCIDIGKFVTSSQKFLDNS